MKGSKKPKDVFSAALDYVGRSNLSEFELVSRLERKLYPPDEIREALKKMVEYGYVDDHKVVESLMRKAQRDCRGPRWLESYLFKKRIPEELRREAIDALRESSVKLATQLLETRMNKSKARETLSKEKLYRFLAARGFYPDAINAAFNELEIRF